MTSTIHCVIVSKTEKCLLGKQEGLKDREECIVNVINKFTSRPQERVKVYVSYLSISIYISCLISFCVKVKRIKCSLIIFFSFIIQCSY